MALQNWWNSSPPLAQLTSSMPLESLFSTNASILISTYNSLCCIRCLSLCLSTKQQHNFFLNNLQYLLTKSTFLVNQQLPKLIPKNKTQPAFIKITSCYAPTHTMSHSQHMPHLLTTLNWKKMLKSIWSTKHFHSY